MTITELIAVLEAVREARKPIYRVALAPKGNLLSEATLTVDVHEAPDSMEAVRDARRLYPEYDVVYCWAI